MDSVVQSKVVIKTLSIARLL